MAVTVEIFGESYTIKGSDNEAHIVKLADYVNKRMNEIATKFTNLTPAKVAILAALNISDDLFQLKDQSLELDNMTKDKFSQIISKIESELTRSYTIVA